MKACALDISERTLIYSRMHEARRLVGWLCAAVAAEAALTIGHFAHGAHVYDDSSRYHVVLPALCALALSSALAGLYARRPSRPALWALVVVVALPFVGMFGLYHGGFGHVAKLLAYAAGASPERLEELFDSPDFAVPNDIVFEVTGVSTLVAAVVVAYFLVRVVRSASAKPREA
jgi:hypothetical protein